MTHFSINPFNLADAYKVGHFNMYPKGMTQLQSNFTPRISRIDGITEVIFFGLQNFLCNLTYRFDMDFFERSKDRVVKEHKEFIQGLLGIEVDTKHLEALHDLRYLPLRFRALDEGTRVPLQVPMFVVENTHPDFAWLVNYIETFLSNEMWKGVTSATIADKYRQILNGWAEKTSDTPEAVDFQGHDFSCRGMSGMADAAISGAGHLLSFAGSDTLVSWDMINSVYPNGKNKYKYLFSSIPATEHSVMCAGGKDTEYETYDGLLDTYPNGFLAIVSDTWNLWTVLTETLPRLKNKIMNRNDRIVIRPDSGNPVDIICGKKVAASSYTINKYEEMDDETQKRTLNDWFSDLLLDEVRSNTPHGECGPTEYSAIYRINNILYEATIHNIEWNRYDKQYYFIDMYGPAKITYKIIEELPENFGVIELLWNTFGGTINSKGYKVLDSHIGAIYGDAITMDRANQICERLEAKGFASTNIVLGIGSYTYQHVTRDTFGMVMKATHCVVNGEERALFKDPVTSNGMKKSAKGKLAVISGENGLELVNEAQKEDENKSLLKTVWEDGRFTKFHTYLDIVNRVGNRIVRPS